MTGSFIVQEAIHADAVSPHDTADEAAAAIVGLVECDLAAPGDFNVREIDANGATVRVFDPLEAT